MALNPLNAIISSDLITGSVQLAKFQMGKIYQVSMIVVMAIFISNLIAFTLWPTSAVKDLRYICLGPSSLLTVANIHRQLMITTTDSFSESVGFPALALVFLFHTFLFLRNVDKG